MSRRLVIGLLIASALGALGAWLELRPSEESRIEDLVGVLAADAQRRDVDAMAPWVSSGYHDERGLTRDGVLKAMREYLKSSSWAKVLPVRVTVDHIDDSRATASAKLILAEAEGSGHKRRVSDAIRIDLELAREDGRWKVLSAQDWEIPAEDATMAQ